MSHRHPTDRVVGGGAKLEISPREDNVQNNVAVKMKFDQRFNVTNVNDRTMLVFVEGALECRG